VRAVQQEHRDIVGEASLTPPQRTLPAERSFLTISKGDAVVTAVYRWHTGETATVRMFNPTDRPVEASIAVPGVKGSPRLVNLAGNAVGDVTREADKVRIMLKPKQIVTVQWAD